ncbi:phenylalanine--tRNA ligase beta subunit [Anaeramoeba flamelloides]|uniref:phenylalanine--tRNA ligase n=1 Tax=Anaeramoeba flamelloides TaxID=1746091 RepID=A0AAV7Z9C0_9EUKA|nr:phenylalanine--tRNA ligase beta subunit [Anaeramoeba flamelloides]
MPTIALKKLALFKAIGKTYTDEEFEQLCFDFGIELDDIEEEIENQEKVIVYKIDLPANRYDLLCLEGLARSLRIFLGLEEPPVFKVKELLSETHKMTVLPECAKIRPYVVCAVLKDITFTKENLKSFKDLQEKLHHNICRRRKLVAIGTHDLDTIEGPFTYEALIPSEINFKPLNQTKKMNGEELMKFYENDLKLKHFLGLIRESSVYPVIYDKNRTVLSLPPIINGDHSKISTQTKNVFIECTALDLTKAKITLNTVITMFSEYCSEPFTAHPVEIKYPDETTMTTPNLDYVPFEVSLNYVNKLIGINIDADKMSELLYKMQLEEIKEKRTVVYSNKKEIEKEEEEEEEEEEEKEEGGKKEIVDYLLTIKAPPTRSDILHACDVAEDVGIAYGFNNIVKTTPKSNTIGDVFPLNELTELLRYEIAQAGYTEALTFALCSHDDCFKKMRVEDNKKIAAVIENAKSKMFQIARISLLPGLLKTRFESDNLKLPIKLFEVSDVVLLDQKSEIGSKNVRRCAGFYSGTTDGFEYIHGLLDRIMEVLDVPCDLEGEKTEAYYIRETDHPSYLPGRCASVFYRHKQVGYLGVLHPEVLINFKITTPCSVLEIDLEEFL